MQSLLIVAVPIFVAQHFCFCQRGEDLAVEQLITQAAVEALAIGVLPWAAGLDVESLEALLGDPFAHRFGDELRTVVAADELRCSGALCHGCFQHAHHIAGIHPPLHF